MVCTLKSFIRFCRVFTNTSFLLHLNKQNYKQRTKHINLRTANFLISKIRDFFFYFGMFVLRTTKTGVLHLNIIKIKNHRRKFIDVIDLKPESNNNECEEKTCFVTLKCIFNKTKAVKNRQMAFII